ncbi:MAG: hypothetical protein LBI63_01640 [Candidatus Ancillula sp.]|nr:hypothetical protein [Candidatus Ancillula sp.]
MVLLLAFSVSSCSNTGNTGGEANSSALSMSSKDGVDDWAQEILKDGEITDEELAYAKQKENECYSKYNSSIEYDEYGYETTHTNGSPDDLQKAMSECGKSTGGIVSTYYMKKTNPNNEDIYQLQAKCVVKKGLAPEGFLVEDLMNMYKNHSFAWDTSSKEWEKCQKDPQDLLNK